MPDTALDAAMRNLRTLVAGHGRKELSDAELLRAFAAKGDQEAFAVLVKRHGPVVLALCRRVLRQTEDAEDAFQATFIMLARRAAALAKRDSLTGWLHGVALRLSLNARRAAGRRRKHESRSTTMPTKSPESQAAWREVQSLLDEEIQRLPAKLREPFVLCTLVGQSCADTAKQIGIAEGTVWSRLAEGRKRLQQQLSRKGVELSAVLGAVAVATDSASAKVPIGLAAKAVEAGVAAAVSGSLPAASVSAGAAILVRSMIMSTMLKKLTLGATAMLLTVSVIVGGAVTLGTYPLSGSETPERKGEIDSPIAGKVPKQALAQAQAAAQKAERNLQADYTKSIRNLKRIGLAMHSYAGDFGHFPPPAIMSKDKKALLSWRVAILPYVNEGALFKEFNLDEPWDSAHNKKLLARMPSLYAPPGIKTPEPYTTFYQVFVGPGSIFEGPEGCRIRDVPDGTAYTVLVVEAGTAVPWTKPQELTYQKNKDLPKLGGIFDGEFYALVADASVLRVRRNPDPKQMHRFIQRNDGNEPDVSGLVREQP